MLISCRRWITHLPVKKKKKQSKRRRQRERCLGWGSQRTIWRPFCSPISSQTRTSPGIVNARERKFLAVGWKNTWLVSQLCVQNCQNRFYFFFCQLTLIWFQLPRSYKQSQTVTRVEPWDIVVISVGYIHWTWELSNGHDSYHRDR